MKISLKPLFDFWDILLGARCGYRICRGNKMTTAKVYPGGWIFSNRCPKCGHEAASPYFLP